MSANEGESSTQRRSTRACDNCKRGPQPNGRRRSASPLSPRSSSRWSTRPEHVSPRRQKFGGVPDQLVDQLLPLYFSHIHSLYESRNECRIDLIQCLLLLSLRQTGCGDKQSASMYAGRACCMALNMGLNLAPGGLGKSLDTTEKEIRSRVYWNIYVLDKSLAEETGRPFLLTYRRTTTPLPSTDELEEFEAWPPPTISATISSSVGVVPRRGHVLSCFAWTCRLAMVVEDVLDMDPSCPPAIDEWDVQFINSIEMRQPHILERPAIQLDKWLQSLPIHLTIDRSLSPLPHHAVLLSVSEQLSRIQLICAAFDTTSPDMDIAHKAKGGLHLSSNDSDQPSDPLPSSSENTAHSPSISAGLHAIRRNLSISEIDPVIPSPTTMISDPNLDPSNLFQLPQLYWNHLNTAGWNPNLDMTLTEDPTWAPSNFDIAENWLENLSTAPSETSLSNDAVQTALMSFMVQAARGGEI
ncbi:uncharacterized protein IL334_001860 [Kwoniella shivajii]|uniref:Xylanolytic transcriptional activator regulatory domain-containing protein n=1 Tax=Kwoniella shivajii TaxID=564305 RepID=A0ABZ1CTG3_9TREE|nr:hypothetical protein IL334_001860 [Kwoniella shivajii]